MAIIRGKYNYRKVCRRCGLIYKASGRESKLCDSCRIPAGKYSRKKQDKTKKWLLIT